MFVVSGADIGLMDSRPGGGMFRYRLWLVLAAIAVVPLLGASWFAGNEVFGARDERARVEDVDSAGQRLIALSELRTQLLDERNWEVALGGIDEAGLTPEIVMALTGIDIPSELESASQRVDELVESEGLDEIGAELVGIRGTSEIHLMQIGDRYSAVELEVARETNELLENVFDHAGDIQGSGALARGLRVLEASTIARQAVSSEFSHYFQAQFGDITMRGDELTSLVRQDTIRSEAVAELDRIAVDGSATRGVIDAIGRSLGAVSFTNAVTSLVADRTAVGEDGAAPTSSPTDIRSLATVFEALSETTNLYFDLVEASRQDMSDAGTSASTAAQERNQQALTWLAGVVGLSVLVAVSATRVIVGPVHRLGVAARELSAGASISETLVESGPVEVRDAARAINEASAHLDLAERQALALAEGELHHESLQEPSSGSLGASLQAAVRTLAVSLQEREEFRRQITYEATHDGLTQLSNRNASLGELKRGLVRSTGGKGSLAALFVDLDGFKDINDHHGHHAGDVVLQVIAGRLADTVRDSDHVGRLGGDEFLIIAEPIQDYDEAFELAQRLHEVIVAPIQVDNTTVAVGASVGIALTSEDECTPEELLRDADLAVYQAKDLGRDRIELCDDALKATMLERVDLEQSIRAGLMDEEFVMYYQPIVNIHTETIVGYEALIRWNRADHGLVAPDRFIPFAEKSDLINTIDQWAVRSVAKQIVSWESQGQHADMAISVNVSGRTLNSSGFVPSVVGPLDEYGIDPSRVIVEITESSILGDLSSAALKLQELRQRGIRIAIDDFGTGYTSLAHLKRLPIDILKIDRSFTNDESAQSLVQLIIDTGHLLGASVTAEGIETQDQATSLANMGADKLQGYLYGSPRPADELRVLAAVPRVD